RRPDRAQVADLMEVNAVERCSLESYPSPGAQTNTPPAWLARRGGVWQRVSRPRRGWACPPGVRPGVISVLRKEVIQPQVPLRLPCYDLVPIDRFVFGACPLAVGAATSDAPIFRGLTGGVYK